MQREGKSELVGDLPGVVEYTYTVEDIDAEGTTRTEDGYMHREIVRSGVVHASVVHIVTREELELISEAIKSDSTTYIELYVPGAPATTHARTYYCSRYTAELIREWNPATGDRDDWWRVSYELVEV